MWNFFTFTHFHSISIASLLLRCSVIFPKWMPYGITNWLVCVYFRCKAKGQIASHGYKHSSFSEGHFVVFDESKFGMVWLELMSFSIYYRVDDKELNDWNDWKFLCVSFRSIHVFMNNEYSLYTFFLFQIYIFYLKVKIIEIHTFVLVYKF